MKRTETFKAVGFAVLVVLSVVLGAVASTGVATAQSDDGIVADIFDDEDDDVDWSERIRGLVSGLVDRLTARGEGEATAEAAADALAAEFNTHNSSFESYVNDRTSASTDENVLEVKFVVDDETESRYLVADVSNSSYENSSMVASTDREVDETCTLEGDAARRAAEELDEFHTRFVEENRDVTEAYLSHLAAEYGSKVSCTFETEGE